MWNYLGKLRLKSDRQKEVISFGVSFVLTLTIFSLWLSSFESDGGQLAKVSGENVPREASHAVDLAPLTTVKNSFGEVQSLFRGLFQSDIHYSRE